MSGVYKSSCHEKGLRLSIERSIIECSPALRLRAKSPQRSSQRSKTGIWLLTRRGAVPVDGVPTTFHTLLTVDSFCGARTATPTRLIDRYCRQAFELLRRNWYPNCRMHCFSSLCALRTRALLAWSGMPVRLGA
ncbi:hypothetical protein TIFTF001_044716 [Ficus carica]|uniref:Uncharacterized protein n=1 Tax=Ficus carica TaxID=3494 RepID=A0AA87ZDE4_FICCA|nr:hypothetical protein TIFTF001_044716 [Ficus carica]